MCGIAGFFGKQGSDSAIDVVLGMLRSQRHRGPDGAGIHARNDKLAISNFATSPGLIERPDVPGAMCVLGHNLLAIQDGTHNSLQPMHLGPLTIAFNGEIYNFVELRREMERRGNLFRTRGDTEVILHLWLEKGIDSLRHLRGMFAFLIHDARDGSITAVRDPFGIKPVYFVRSNDGVYFGSEIRSFHAAGVQPRRLRPGAALASCAAGAQRFAEFESLYEGVFELPAGHWMRLSRGEKEKIERWYSLPPLTNKLEADTDCGALGQILEESVSLHLRSTRRVTSCLSGGLDSSTLVTLIGRHQATAGEDFAAFTMNSAEQADSEIQLAREVALKAGLVHQVFDCQTVIPPTEALDMALAYEIPNHVIGPINQFRLLRHIGESGGIVVLDGQGGDELLSGYSWWFPVLLADMRARGQSKIAGAIEQERQRHLPFDAARTNQFDQIFYDPHAWLRGFMGNELLGTPIGAVAALPEFRYFFEHDGTWSGFRERAYTVDHIPFLLRQEDRLGMRFGLETRVPYVDIEVVKVVADFASSLLIHGGYLKYPLRRMDSGIPDSVRWCTRKRGFWDTSDARFPWMKELALRFARQSDLLRGFFPRLEQDWETTRSDQQWRLLQIAFLERCSSVEDIPALIHDVAPALPSIASLESRPC